MNINSIVKYIRKAKTSVDSLNYREGKKGTAALFSYMDFLYCYLRYGCLINQYVNGNFWRYRGFERKKILTYGGVVEFITKCNSSNHIHKLENKVKFNEFFHEDVRRRWLYSRNMDIKDFNELCNVSPELIIKPLDDCEGRGIELVRVPETESERKELYGKLSSQNLVIEERIFNHPRMVFNNKSINTIRINSIMDRDGNVHLFKPVLRAGVGDAFVDNYNAGGCEYAIDLKTGVIISLCYYNYSLNGVTHPGCDIIMPGYRIPMWDEVIETVTRAAEKIPECRFVGWDVAITDNGIELIEGNHNPGNVGIEFFGETGWYEKLKKYI